MAESEFELDGFDYSLYSLSHKIELAENLFALRMKQMQEN